MPHQLEVIQRLNFNEDTHHVNLWQANERTHEA